MTVYENLAFPLRNRGVAPADIKKQVMEIAEMLELVDSLDRRASGLTADAKQKISLGRGLVRSDFNAIMFDEPLTVIDPHLKWQLRSKLRYLHKRFSHTMIYVTHDQTEALTFADRVVVMHDGEIVQVGTSEELFDKPHHTFVGYFIGSPGMNVLPCTLESGKAMVAGHAVKDLDCDAPADTGRTEVGVRPEFVSFDTRGVPCGHQTRGRHRPLPYRRGGAGGGRVQDAGPRGGPHTKREPPGRLRTRSHRDLRGRVVGPVAKHR